MYRLAEVGRLNWFALVAPSSSPSSSMSWCSFLLILILCIFNPYDSAEKKAEETACPSPACVALARTWTSTSSTCTVAQAGHTTESAPFQRSAFYSQDLRSHGEHGQLSGMAMWELSQDEESSGMVLRFMRPTLGRLCTKHSQTSLPATSELFRWFSTWW